MQKVRILLVKTCALLKQAKQIWEYHDSAAPDAKEDPVPMELRMRLENIVAYEKLLHETVAAHFGVESIDPGILTKPFDPLLSGKTPEFAWRSVMSNLGETKTFLELVLSS